MKPILLAACFFLFAGCSKTIDWGDMLDNNGSGNGDQPVTLKVLESRSYLPVAGATLIVEKCSSYDIEFGCVGFATVASLVTDAQGSCTISSKVNIERLQASHPSYWPDWSGSKTVYLIPEAWARVHLRKVNSYPENCQMVIGKLDTRFTWNAPPIRHEYRLRFNVPSDTTVMIRLYGDEQDKIWWDVYQGNNKQGEGSVTLPIIPKWTTADVTIEF